LLYPLAILSGIAVVLLLGVVNSVFVLLILRRDGRMTGWRQAALPLLLGLSLAMIELAVVGLARAALESWAGSPF
jgi:peptidoglycan biosynthesis protein MviN/MurJ (putative lipid II flippase)